MQWSQPATGNNDMTKQAILTAYKRTPAITLIEGEAAGSYIAKAGVRPALERFRRTFIWVEGKYVLVLDDIRAPEKVKIDWLMQGHSITTTDAAANKYKLVAKSNDSAAFNIVADKAFTVDFRTSTADDHGNVLGHRQLVLTADADKLRVAGVYAPWGGDYTVKADWSNPSTAKITVLKDGRETDGWQWQTSVGMNPSSIRNAAGNFAVTNADKAPAP